ncbi:PLC-like phosphodiesterase [Apiosordaria backusii]|uniref:PLC-like phosphodiesterase n=1 Tax=Apiosordaria backusii TaxID=314023 RepID=A0AA40EFK8_9PEZI|nr:PLC-like phosphodiesterase [Apiosordaria backusii]
MAAEEIPSDKPPEVSSSDFLPTLEKPSIQNGDDDDDDDGKKPPKKNLPQIIAHRGYKALYPENSMLAFEEAIKAGAHAIETDVHLSKDGVVVLSHDPTLKRCFSLPTPISSLTWPYLSTLLTTAPPHVPLARLSDLLSYLSLPALSHIWILIDIKTDDDPNLTLVPAIASTIASHPPPDGATWTWQERIILGGWNENYLLSLGEHLPGFKRAYIGFSLLYAKRFLDDKKWPGVGFNLLQQSLVGPVGGRFVKRIRGAKTERGLWVWTVNERGWMRWAMDKGVDGVVTDEVGLLREVLDEEGEEKGEGRKKGRVSVGMYFRAVVVQVLTVVLVVVIWGRLRRVGRVVEGKVRKKQEEKVNG